MPDHPGGDDIILEWAGKDIGQIMADPSSHVHSRSAYEMMDEYLVGELGGDEQIVSESTSHIDQADSRLGCDRRFSPRRDRCLGRL